MKRILFIFGTRPEGIKMAPLIKEFKENTDLFDVRICITAQHREMLDQVLDFFSIEPDFDLNIMQPGQDLVTVSSNILINISPVIAKTNPDLVIVQGDTATVFIAALAAYYYKIPIAHLEAGLRTGQKYSPFPEEMNRILTDHLADFHFAPTTRAEENLNAEGITKNVHVVGNTVIDALLLGLKNLQDRSVDSISSELQKVNCEKKIILITGHRRENLGKPFKDFCQAIRILSKKFSDCEFVYPVHFNPNVRSTVNGILLNINNVHLIEPLDYPEMIWIMNQAYLVLTDSGGIQEEAPTLGKPVLVTREFTERQEGVEAGTAKLVGTNTDKIVAEVTQLITDNNYYDSMSKAVSPYGDGTSSEKIVSIVKDFLDA